MLRSIFCSVFLFFAPVFSLAADFSFKIIAPDSNPVAGARVSLYKPGSTAPIATVISSAEGIADFVAIPQENYSLEVLAAGFSPLRQTIAPSSKETTVRLSISAPPQTVVVTATRTALPLDETGRAEEALDASELSNLQPISAADALRVLPGAIISDSGQLGGITSLFVRGGDSRYNKVIIDGVPVDEPGGTFNFGTVPLTNIDRLEFLRGAESTLYGSNAMTSVVNMWTASGHTQAPELTFGADGGNFSTAHGDATLAGAYGKFDYDLFADQFNTQGSGVNDSYSNSSQGGNIGWQISPKVMLRLRSRHSNSRSGVQGEWDFNGTKLLNPDIDQRARQNDLLGSLDLTIVASSHWEHELTGFEYHETRLNEDEVADRGCDLLTTFLDCFFHIPADFNRAGLNYQTDYTPRSWLHSTLGYEFEDETGAFNSTFLTINSITFLPDIENSFTHGLRRNHAIFGQQIVTWKRLSFVGGVRYVNNESFGQRVVPHATLTDLLFRGNELFSGTRLRAAYGEGIKEPRFEETFGITGSSFPTIPNPNLKPEQNRSLEAGLEQQFASGKYALSGTYFNNRFRNQIDFETFGCLCKGEYININKSQAHGAELEFKARPTDRLSVTTAYNFVPTKIVSDTFDFAQVGLTLLRRPKQSGTLLVNYAAPRWGAELGGTFVGRRRDSDFFEAPMPVNYAAGYALFNTGGWYAINHLVTAYANIDNLLDKEYNEVVGYPALGIAVRAGLRFRLGGE